MADVQITHGSDASLIVTPSKGFDAVTRRPIPYTDFVTADTPSATVWQGGDLAGLFVAEASWVGGSATSIRVRIHAPQTADLAPGVYRCLVQVTPAAGDGHPVDVATISAELLPRPGTATPGPTYCAAADLLDEVPWLDTIQDDASTAGGYLKARERARDWLDGLILAAEGGGGSGRFGAHSDAIANWGGGGALGGSDELRERLAAGALVVDGRVRRVAALYAAGKYLLGRFGAGKDTNGYAAKGALLVAEAEALATTLVARVDADAQGRNARTIALGLIPTRYA